MQNHVYLLANLRSCIKFLANRCQLLIYALGTVSSSSGTPRPASSVDFRQSEEFLQAEGYFLTARKRMGMLLGGNDIIDAQCFFLAGVYLMVTLRPFPAWSMFVQALVCCEGFHSSLQVPPDDLYQHEEHTLRQSIYWTCFKSELYVFLIKLPQIT